ncbi:hypothetical protein FRX31_026441 [Thalictrum thalictroides]|uniref:Uncharacterized protein n=1 Tax=Thalictrum thalictroides TaxID=46969 RepID=A0A7J6VGE4_THATH|nr:hypothetical protein FRX31_026441 [Thalictrum thalictroides]
MIPPIPVVSCVMLPSVFNFTVPTSGGSCSGSGSSPLMLGFFYHRGIVIKVPHQVRSSEYNLHRSLFQWIHTLSSRRI